MRIALKNFCLFMILLSAAPVAALPTPPVERIAAVVNKQIIFLTDIGRYQTFFQKERTPSKENFQAALQELIDDRLLRVEAHRFIAQAPSNEEIDRAIAGIRKRFANEAAFQEALRQTDFSKEEFKRDVQEHLWVEKLLQERVSAFIFVSPKEAEAYYRDHSEDFSGKKLEAVAPQIEATLTAQKEAAKKKEYLTRLRSHAEIEINLQP